MDYIWHLGDYVVPSTAFLRISILSRPQLCVWNIKNICEHVTWTLLLPFDLKLGEWMNKAEIAVHTHTAQCLFHTLIWGWFNMWKFPLLQSEIKQACFVYESKTSSCRRVLFQTYLFVYTAHSSGFMARHSLYFSRASWKWAVLTRSLPFCLSRVNWASFRLTVKRKIKMTQNSTLKIGTQENGGVQSKQSVSFLIG